MGKYTDRLAGQKIVVIGGSTGIGYGAAAAFVAVGADVTIISSSQANVDAAVATLRQVEVEVKPQPGTAPPVRGVVADVRDEAAFTAALRALAPVDHGLAAELVGAGKRVRVNTVVPGLVQTPLWDKLGHSQEAQRQLFEQGGAKLSVGFVATPEHIAEAYLYTVRADYANGTVVLIDGGSSYVPTA
ncbi:oxidoreductase [Niveomyces insectorum RCEF 264]|uniref:Oxidoreductase n=1 Tax=Niveomyces insectorum RCEF 264 TaxID=1081102 RepID=A0A167P758_9HYPO|nr:oxidoreductase [Niveomyces insectorum RCEF 264]